MFEVEVAQCKGAKEALVVVIDGCMRHVEEFCDTFGEEAFETQQDTVKLEAAVEAWNASFQCLVKQMRELARQLKDKG